MNPSKILRIAVIAEIALIPVGIAVSFWADTFLPSDVVTLEENQNTAFTDLDSIGPGMMAFILAGLAISGAWIASIIGLLKLKRWGAWLYLFTAFLALPIYFMTGFEVNHPIDQIFYDIFRFIPGFIIGLAFFSGAIPKKTANKTLHPTAGNAPV
jgi:urea transporter